MPGLVRAHEPSFGTFVAQDGFSILMRAMQSGVEKLQMKSSFLLCALCQVHTNIKGKIFYLFLSSVVSLILTEVLQCLEVWHLSV